jgi:hypothetical protein
LGIKVDDEDPLSSEGEIAPEIHDRCGLADAAFLVRASDRLAHSASCSVVSHDA